MCMIIARGQKGKKMKQKNTYDPATGQYMNPENKSLGEIYKEGMTKGFSDGYEAGYKKAQENMEDDGK